MESLRKVFKNISKAYRRWYPLSFVMLLAVIIGVVYYKVVFLYFWVDDWDLFLKTLHTESALWGMDPGPFGSGPYRYLHTPFVILYPLLKLNAGAYFLVSIIIYFAVTVSLFFLLKELGLKRLAPWVALIFASIGYIGSYTLTHLSNSYQIYLTLLLTCLTLLTLAKHFKSGKIFFYLLSLLFFYATVEFMFLRAHGAIFQVVALTILFFVFSPRQKHKFLNLLKLVPFILIFQQMYKQVYAGPHNTASSFLSLMSRETSGYLFYPFGVLSNVIVPDFLVKDVYKVLTQFVSGEILRYILLVIVILVLVRLWRIDGRHILVVVLGLGVICFNIFWNYVIKQPVFAILDDYQKFLIQFGFFIFIFSLVYARFLWLKQKREEAKLLLFGLIWIFTQYIGYFVYMPSQAFLASTERYLTPSTLGSSILIAILVFTILRNYPKVYYLVIFLVVAFYANALSQSLETIIKDVSIPTKKMYEQIRKDVPTLPDNAVVALDIVTDPMIRYRVSSSYPGTALGIFYNKNFRVPIVDLADIISRLQQGTITYDDIYTFYIYEDGVINTSGETRQRLMGEAMVTSIRSSDWSSNIEGVKDENFFSVTSLLNMKGSEIYGVNPRIEVAINHSSAVPSKLTLGMVIKPLALPASTNFWDVSGLFFDKVDTQDLEVIVPRDDEASEKCQKRLTILQAEKEHRDFIKMANLAVSSWTLGNEKHHLLDNRFNTTWNANGRHWSDTKSEDITIDLRQIKEVRRFFWVNYLKRTTPIKYKVESSVDANLWKELVRVGEGKPRGNEEVVTEVFPPEHTRFLRFTINQTLSGAAPIVSELWVDNIQSITEYQDVLKMRECPLCCRTSSGEYSIILPNLLRDSHLRIWWTTEAQENYTQSFSDELPVIPDGKYHEYAFILPAGGKEIKSLRISGLTYPVKISIFKTVLETLSLNEIVDAGALKE